MQAKLENIPFKLDRVALAKSLRIDTGSDDFREFENLIGEAVLIARPKAVYRECFVSGRQENAITIEHVAFVSRALGLKLASVERVFAYVATCGRELDGIEIAADDFVKKYWLDGIKQSLLAASLDFLNASLKRVFRLGNTVSMNPGSGDASIWPIEQQAQLFSLFGDVESLIGVRLTDTCLMIPNKSVSGIRFETEANFTSCQLCRREKCVGRKAPFDPALWEIVNPGHS